MASASFAVPTREQLLHSLYEAAELEHNLMCTYLYAAFSLRSGETEGLTAHEDAGVNEFRRVIVEVATQEMAHLAAVWNITSALGGTPRFGRANFPLDPGLLPAGIVVKLAPFGEAALQHFIHLERPASSLEPEGKGFEPELLFERGSPRPRLTPMAVDYETVGAFYAGLGDNLRAFAEHHGEERAFVGDAALQLSAREVPSLGVTPVVCSKTALAAFLAIVEQGEGAPEHSEQSHFQKFLRLKGQLKELKARRPEFEPAYPAATNPVLRRPVRRERVWIEDEQAAETVDLANAAYTTMLRLLGYSYQVPSESPEKRLAIDLSRGLMRAVTLLAERAARLPAGASNPGCHAGMSFTSLRDAAPLPPGRGARQFFTERLQELAEAAAALARDADSRTQGAERILHDLAARARQRFEVLSSRVEATVPDQNATDSPPAPRANESDDSPPVGPLVHVGAASPPIPKVIDGVEHIEGKHLTLMFESKRCIHARFCVTGAPRVFLANVKGPWIDPDAMSADGLIEIAHACPSGAIHYRPKGERPEEQPPPVNLIAVREAGPYAVRGALELEGSRASYRATLCRCGASKNKPFCDGSHHEVGFSASGEPPTGSAEMLAERDGPLEIDPQVDGPLEVRGNLEITSGTGRVVARVTAARLCRCGHSNNKPFCDGSHVRVGFRSA